MNPDEYKVVRLTNRTGFDFTPEMGAKYGGVPYLIPAGKSLLMPKPAAKLLAKHLARQMYIKKAPLRDASELDGKGTDRPLWTEEDCLLLADTLLSEEYEEEKVNPQTPAEIIHAKIQELNKMIEDSPSENSAAAEGYMDKAQVIAELQKREIAFDARLTKNALEKLLK